MNNEQEWFARFDEIRAKFRTATQWTIAAIQAEYNAACDDFRRWAKDNPARVPAEKFRAKSECVIHKIRWTGERKIEIVLQTAPNMGEY